MKTNSRGQKILTVADLPLVMQQTCKQLAKVNVRVELAVHAGTMDLIVDGIGCGAAQMQASLEARSTVVKLPEKHWMGSDGESNSSTTYRYTAGYVVRRFDRRSSKEPVSVHVDVVLRAPEGAFAEVNLSRVVREAGAYGLPWDFDEMRALSIALDGYKHVLPGQAEVTAALAKMADEKAGERRPEVMEALQTLPAGVTSADILDEPAEGALWDGEAFVAASVKLPTPPVPPIGSTIRSRFFYPANGRGVDVEPGTPGIVVGYLHEAPYLYAITQFPGKAVAVAACDVVHIEDGCVASDLDPQVAAMEAAGWLS